VGNDDYLLRSRDRSLLAAVVAESHPRESARRYRRPVGDPRLSNPYCAGSLSRGCRKVLAVGWTAYPDG
jgi:hypothetical protein